MLLFGRALAIPLLREFYELTLLGRDAVVAWAVSSVLGIGGLLAALTPDAGVLTTPSRRRWDCARTVESSGESNSAWAA